MKRSSGVLLHISSLPSEFGIGDLGPEAYRFADFLHRAGQKRWQLLPVNPTLPKFSHSPYSSPSASAGNGLFISPEMLQRDGLLSSEDLEKARLPVSGPADFSGAVRVRRRIFKKAWDVFQKRPADLERLEAFEHENRHWLHDYTRFDVLSGKFGTAFWDQWPAPFRSRRQSALDGFDKTMERPLRQSAFIQYCFFGQWQALKKYCHLKGIRFIGDAPIYVSFCSADVWANRPLFKLSPAGKMAAVSGCPPDYFSKTGQRWGTPVYRWSEHTRTGYKWWINRIGINLRLFDYLRIDHFRGLVQYWEVPASHRTAEHGTWQPVPVDDFITRMGRKYPLGRIIAEDLGEITPDVRQVMRKYGLPGMKILQFAFGKAGDPSYRPENHIRHCLAYVGTHDNNTARGWFEKELDSVGRREISQISGFRVGPAKAAGELVRMAMASRADTVIMTAQDLLGLGEEARMNRPGSTRGNWKWRLKPGKLKVKVADWLKSLVRENGRL